MTKFGICKNVDHFLSAFREYHFVCAKYASAKLQVSASAKKASASKYALIRFKFSIQCRLLSCHELTAGLI